MTQILNAQKPLPPALRNVRWGGDWGVQSCTEGSGRGEWPWSPTSLPCSDCGTPLPPPPTENGAFFCNECDCRFSEEASLKRHTLQTHSDKPYKCDRCQASFRYKGNLASHKTVHTGMALPPAPQLARVTGGGMEGRTLEKAVWGPGPHWAEAASRPCFEPDVDLTLSCLCLATYPLPVCLVFSLRRSVLLLFWGQECSAQHMSERN